MKNDYQSESKIFLELKQAKALNKKLGGTGYLDALAPNGVDKQLYAMYGYRVIVYHPSVESVVIKYMKRVNKSEIEFKQTKNQKL